MATPPSPQSRGAFYIQSLIYRFGPSLVGANFIDAVSTALSLSERHPESQIIVVESSPTIPNPHGSSVDSSRVIRADYFNPTYAKLGTEALERWRSTGWGQSGRYSETGLLLVYPEGDALAKSKVETYYDNVKGTVQEGQVEWLPTRQAVQKVVPHYNISDLIGGGYVNWTGGWADAAEGVRYAKSKLDQRENVTFRTAEVNRLLFEGESETQPSRSVKGVILSDGSSLVADLVILATGAWTPKLVDLRGRAEATGQVMAYVNITDEEQRQLENMPTILNLGTGMFTIPPRGNVLKVARHGYGYRNMQKVATAAPAHRSNEADETIEVSIPKDGISIPLEGEQACRIALKELFPSMADRPFIRTRVCWYTDT